MATCCASFEVSSAVLESLECSIHDDPAGSLAGSRTPRVSSEADDRRGSRFSEAARRGDSWT